MHRLMAIVCLFFALAARGDTFGELKSAVGRLGARQAVRATFASEVKVKAAGKFANEAVARSMSVDVVHDMSGVTITVPQALVEKAGRGSDETAQNAIDAIRAMHIVEALDYRGAFLHILNCGTVAEEKRVVFRGKAARLLVLNLKVPLRKGNSISIGSSKVAEDRLSVWVGDDNLPLAAERTRKTSGGFLIFHSDMQERTSITFAQAGDRLILTRLETTSNGSGMSQTFDEHSVQTVTLH
jgi:hypothetical protein